MVTSEKYQLDGVDSKGYAVLPIGGFPCLYCTHLISDKEHRCQAFLEGIPIEIWNGENDHSKPFPGDNGITFKSVIKTA
jgi:hypothetical protein